MRLLAPLDKTLILLICFALAYSMVMVASASLAISDHHYQQPWFFAMRHGAYIGLGLIAMYSATRIPSSLWYRLAPFLLVLSLVLLVAVLIPGIGKTINGSKRWIGVGGLTVQISELAKYTVILWLSYFFVQRQVFEEATNKYRPFVMPLIVFTLVAGLLLLEPDFGATVVISLTVAGLLFLAGIPMRVFAILSACIGLAFALLAFAAPYRLARLTAFLNPWADQYNSGYQLTQSLIAFGRGESIGLGLGNSIQKLMYLPEAHTDFLVAVTAEELGFVGIIALLSLYSAILYKLWHLAYKAFTLKAWFPGFFTSGVFLWCTIQLFVNVGVNMGMLPTKGLTLPLFSFGGSSIIVLLFVFGIILRMAAELNERTLPEAQVNLGRKAHG